MMVNDLTPSLTTQPVKHFRRVLQLVLVLIVFFIFLVIWMSESSWFASKSMEILVKKINDRGQLNIVLENFSGNVVSGIMIEKLHLKQLNPPMQLEAAKIEINFNFNRLQKGIIAISGGIASLDARGMLNSGIASLTIPEYHGMACFAGIPANLQIASFTVASASFQPWNDLPLKMAVRDIKIEHAASLGGQQISLLMGADWRNKKIGIGQFSGLLKQGNKKLEGRLNLCVAGQKLVSEINISEKKGQPEVSGYISSASIDVAHLSHWLVPVWQDSFPFGFDGWIDCSGSWLFNREMGFLGNLAGQCRNLRMVALGLFISVFELNGNWKLFDGNFNFLDSGSKFFGFPASLTGRIESVFERSRKWELDFDSKGIDFAQLADGLPWGVKYGMALPAISGGATMSVQLRGARPEISARLDTSDLRAGKEQEIRNICGNIDFLLGAKGPGKLTVVMECRSKQPPPLFQRFKGRSGTFMSKVVQFSGPYCFAYSMSGKNSAQMSLTGAVMAADQCLAKSKGRWHEGMGDLTLFPADENSGSEHFSVNHIPLLDFILAK